MLFNIFTSALVLAAPLTAVAAPLTATSPAPATTSAVNAQPAINNAWEIVSSLSSTLNFHELSINFTLAILPESPSDGQKASANSSVTNDISAMTAAIQAASASVKEITRISGQATQAEIQAVDQVNSALRALVYRSSGTVKNAANTFRAADIIVVGGIFGPFIALFETFIADVEGIFLGFVPGVEALADSLVAVLETILAIL